MKLFRNLITLILLASAAIAVQAQDRPLLTADVPFAFTVDDVQMPAGSYTVSSLASYGSLMVRNADGRHVAFIRALNSTELQRASEGKLVFRQIGNDFFLTQVWERGSDTHREVRNGKRATQLARNSSAPQLVTVLATAKNGRHS
jgi:hypothetical protein